MLILLGVLDHVRVRMSHHIVPLLSLSEQQMKSFVRFRPIKFFYTVKIAHIRLKYPTRISNINQDISDLERHLKKKNYCLCEILDTVKLFMSATSCACAKFKNNKRRMTVGFVSACTQTRKTKHIYDISVCQHYMTHNNHYSYTDLDVAVFDVISLYYSTSIAILS